MTSSTRDQVQRLQVNGPARSALLACGLFVTIGLFSPGLVLPEIARAFAGTPRVALCTQLVGAVAGFSFALAAPFCGKLIAHVGCRRVLLAALPLFAFTGALPVILNSLWLIVATRILLGIATAAIFTGGLAGIGTLPGADQARLFGWFSVVGGLAAIVLFPVVGQLGHFGWRPAFLVHLVSLLVIPLALTLPATLGCHPMRGDKAAFETRAPALNAVMAGLLAIAALAGMSMMLSPIYGPIYLASLGITDTRLASIPLTIAAITAVAGACAYGALNRRIGIIGTFIFASIAMGLALAVAGLTNSVIIFTASIAGMSAMVALLAPNLNAAAVAFNRPERTAQAIGLINGAMFGAQLLFPFVAGWTRALIGLSGVFLVFGIAMLMIGLVAGLQQLKVHRKANR